MDSVVKSFNYLVETINVGNKNGSYSFEQSAEIYKSLNVTKDFLEKFIKQENEQKDKKNIKNKLQTIYEDDEE